MHRQKRQREETDYQVQLLQKYSAWNENFTEITNLLGIDLLFGNQKNNIESYSNATIALCEAIFSAQKKEEINQGLIQAHWKTYPKTPFNDEDFVRLKLHVSTLVGKARDFALYYTQVYEENIEGEHSEFISSILEMFMITMPFVIKAEIMHIPEFNTKEISWELISEILTKKPLILSNLFRKITQSMDPFAIFHTTLVSNENNINIQTFLFIKKVVTSLTEPSSSSSSQQSSAIPNTYYNQLLDKIGKNNVLYALCRKSIRMLITDITAAQKMQEKTLNISTKNLQILLLCDPEYKTSIDKDGNMVELLYLDKEKLRQHDPKRSFYKALTRQPKLNNSRYHFMVAISSDPVINQTKIIYRLMEPSTN